MVLPRSEERGNEKTIFIVHPLARFGLPRFKYSRTTVHDKDARRRVESVFEKPSIRMDRWSSIITHKNGKKVLNPR